MKRDNLYPMMTTPLNFEKGDVVKKVITDQIQTPYVGVVTSVIPSTNKVEVQWPDSTGIEDPWELIKVNPIINPPVVNKDMFYNTYQNSEKVQDHVDKLKHYNVLAEYVNENVMPVLDEAKKLYNKRKTKKKAFQVLSCQCDNKNIVQDVLDKVYNDAFSVKRSVEVFVDGEYHPAELSMSGNSEEGFNIKYAVGNDKRELYYESAQDAAENFKRLEGILVSLSKSKNDFQVVEDAMNKGPQE